MMNFVTHNPWYSTSEIWIGLLRQIMAAGNRVKPRGNTTLELLGCQSIISMANPVVLVAERKLGYHFMAAEAAWIMSGDNQVKTMAPYSKEIAKFSDDGERFFGAYGPKVIDQLSYIIQTLRKDPDSRQAVMTIWRPTPPQTKDVPCTISAQWLIRDRRLHCSMNMRSSDAWLGVPYDWFNFSMLSLGILVSLNNYMDQNSLYELGYLYFYAASQHLYEDNFDAASRIVSGNNNLRSIRPVAWSDFKDYAAVVEHLKNAANGHIDDTRPSRWLSEVI